MTRWGIFLYCVTAPFSIAASEAGIIAALAGWLLTAILKKEFVRQKNLMTVPILIFLAAQLLSVFFSIDCVRSISRYRSFWHILGFFLVVNCCDAKMLKRGIVLLIASTAAASFLGVCQYGYTRFIATALSEHRISGTMGMYMTYSGILMMMGIVSWALFLFGGLRGKARFAAFFSSILISTALILTLTRSAWIGFAAGIAVIAMVRDWRLLLALFAALVIVFFAAPRDVRERVLRSGGDETTVVKDGKVMFQGDERIFLWYSGIEVIKHNPLTGVGLKNFRKAYPQYLPYAPVKNFSHAHNNFIQIGAETGLIGLLAFIGMILAYLFYIVHGGRLSALPPPSFEKAVITGVLGAFAAFLVAGLFEYNFGDGEIAMLIWFLMAVPIVFTATGQEFRDVPAK